MAGRTGWIDKRLARPEIATQTGMHIRQAFPRDSKAAHMGRTYTVTGQAHISGG